MRPKIPLPPEPFTNEVEKVLEDAAKRKRIRAYAMAALPAVIRNYGAGREPVIVATAAFKIAEEMEKQDNERVR